MSTSNTRNAAERSLRRTRSVGDEPTSSQDGLVAEPTRTSDVASSSTVIRKDPGSRSMRSAGPSFNAFSIPEDQNTTNPPLTPPSPAVLHPSSPPPSSSSAVIATNATQSQRPRYTANAGTLNRLFLFFGYGPEASKARRALVSLGKEPIH